MSTFTFDIKYRAGKQNQDADGLSRRPHGELTNDSASREESQRIHEFTSHHLADVDVVQATCQYHTVISQNESDTSPCYTESLAVHPDAIPSELSDDGSQNGLSTIPKYSPEEIARMQQADSVISVVIKMIESGEPAPTNVKSPELLLMLREVTRFEMKDSLLFRKRQSDNKTVYQLVQNKKLSEMCQTEKPA